MSTTTIRFTLRINTVLTDATSVVLEDPTAAFGVRRTDTGAVVVAAGTALTHVSVGVYEYTITDPAYDLTYNYWVKWVYAGNTFYTEQNQSGTTGPAPSPTPTPTPGHVIPLGTGLIDENENAVKLARYAHIVGVDECALFGVNNSNDEHGVCNPIWSHAQRRMIAKYLGEAQDEIEQVIGYPLSPKYFTDEEHPFRARQLIVRADWLKVIAVGVRAITNIAQGVAVDHTSDPAVIGPVATDVTDPDEIRVYHPGTTIEIQPSSISIVGGNVTIEIPRGRMVKAALEDTPDDGLDYTDTTNFEATVDLVREYTDTATQATLVYPHRGATTCGCSACEEGTATACEYVRNAGLGYIDVMRADYADGVWTAASTCRCSAPESVRINYRAGLTTLTPQAEDTITRLAHSKMPSQPCGCGIANEVWSRDRNVPSVLTGERLNCGFGLSDGAWIAWKFAQAMKVYRGGML